MRETQMHPISMQFAVVETAYQRQRLTAQFERAARRRPRICSMPPPGASRAYRLAHFSDRGWATR